MSETKILTFTHFEALRQVAAEAVGLMNKKGSSNMSGLPVKQALALGRWAAELGDQQAAMGSTDPAKFAQFLNRLDLCLGRLPLLVRLRVQGFTGRDEVIDRARMALGFSGHPDMEDAQELLAVIEAKRIVIDRGLPRYWTVEEKEKTVRGLGAFIDRTISEVGDLSAEKKAVAYKKMGRTIGLLGSNCDLLGLFCAEELEREQELAFMGGTRDVRQAELVSTAEGLLARPSLDASVFNVMLAGFAGLGMAAVAPTVGHALLPYMQELAHSIPYLAKSAHTVGDLAFNYGTAVSCAALAASAGSFFGLGVKASSRLDALGNAEAIKAGLGISQTRAACAKATDARLCESFFHLSDEMLSSSDRLDFLIALGATRKRLSGPLLGPTSESDHSKSTDLTRRLEKIPGQELALLGQFDEPVLAASFLLDARTRSERLNLLALQKKINYLGAGERPLDPDDKALKAALVTLVVTGRGDAYSAVSAEAARSIFNERMAELSPKGRRMAALCPRSQRVELLATIMEKSFDSSRPDYDMAERLQERVSQACARLDAKGFIQRKLSGFVSKITRALIDDPARVLNALHEWVKSKGTPHSQDFKGAVQMLSAASGPMPVPDLSRWADSMGKAQSVHDLANPSISIFTVPITSELGLEALKAKQNFRREQMALSQPSPKSGHAI